VGKGDGQGREGAAVSTVDADFTLYRIHGRRVLPLIRPDNV